MKQIFLHSFFALLLASCVGGGNRGKSGRRGTASTVSAYDVTLLSQSACICKSGIPLSNDGGNCFAICASKPATAQDTLYIDTFLGPAIELDDEIGTLYNWCKKERRLKDRAQTLITNPDCILEAENSQGQVSQLEVIMEPNSQNFEVNVQSLNFDQTYIINLLEVQTAFTSNSIQIRKNKNLNNGPLGNLTQTGISRYNCYVNQVAQGNYIDNIYRLSYFYSITPPLAVPAGTEGIKCHASFLTEPFDDPFFPRLELETNVLTLWSSTDPRFYDNDSDGSIDVHDRIAEAANVSEVNIFQTIEWDREPIQAQADNESEESKLRLLGYLMIPFVYPETHPLSPLRSYCPGNEHYNGNDPLFREIGAITGIETEGLYIGRREQKIIQDPESGAQVTIPANHILLKETTLKRIWFYTDQNGVRRFPTEGNVRNLTVFFYWPAASPGNDPHVKLPSQEVYQLIDGITSNGGAPIHDKKIGCVPKSL